MVAFGIVYADIVVLGEVGYELVVIDPISMQRHFLPSCFSTSEIDIVQ